MEGHLTRGIGPRLFARVLTRFVWQRTYPCNVLALNWPMPINSELDRPAALDGAIADAIGPHAIHRP